MSHKIAVNNIGLQNILYPRLPPFIWSIFGYSSLFYYNRIGVAVYIYSFMLYGLLNIVFDFFSVSFEYSNNIMPNYKNIGSYNFYITNKKYILQNKNNSKPFQNISMIDDSKLKTELSIYIGDYIIVKYLLFFIYLSGITQKNYTINDYDDFKDTIYFFV